MLNLEGHQRRKKMFINAAGPMRTFYIDGNYKLKRFVFSIHECMGGFTRKLMRIVVAAPNNDPLVVAKH